jgi:hypothetical protein
MDSVADYTRAVHKLFHTVGKHRIHIDLQDIERDIEAGCIALVASIEFHKMERHTLAYTQRDTRDYYKYNYTLGDKQKLDLKKELRKKLSSLFVFFIKKGGEEESV